MTASDKEISNAGFIVWSCRALFERHFHPKCLTDALDAPSASNQGPEEGREFFPESRITAGYFFPSIC